MTRRRQKAEEFLRWVETPEARAAMIADLTKRICDFAGELKMWARRGHPCGQDFIAADFFQQAGRFKRRGERFDCVFLDPPIFSTSPTGVVDQVYESARLINKVRPLINDGGTLVAVNNAVYVSGKEYMQTLEALCADGYLKLMELIPVPDDFAGYTETRVGTPITDPAPFNHATKIAVLQVRRNET